LTLNRPAQRNALNLALWQELEGHLDTIEAAGRDIAVVILRSTGPVFCAGNDLKERGIKFPRPFYQPKIVTRIANLPQPVIVAVQGGCFTGGLELALTGDIILASESASFADTHGKFSMVPMWGMSQRLPRRVGQSHAMEMMLSCRTVGAQEALRLGLVNQCLADEGFFDAVDAYAQQVLANSWFSHRANKKLLVQTDGLPLGTGLAQEVYRHEGVGPDVHARIASFLQKKSSKS
jgi:enoyl-CoA hydratase/carnithine racemase